MASETHLRSIIKTITWRLTATLTTVLLVWIFVGDPTIALSVGAVELTAKLLLYYSHERLWLAIKWGSS